MAPFSLQKSKEIRLSNMRKLIFISLILFITISCKENPNIINSIISKDKTLAKIVEFKLINNSAITIKYNEPVEVIDVEFNKTKIPFSSIGMMFTIKLPEEIKRGTTRIFSITAKKENGNITRASFLLIGRNTEIPQVLINEISIKGNAANPDRIELAVLQSGNLAGMVLSDRYADTKGYDFIMPELDVKRGDLVVIHWDSKPKIDKEDLGLGKTAHYLSAKSTSTLIGTNGLLILKSEQDGYIMDAVIYSNYSTEDNSGYGNEKLETTAKKLIEEEHWIGNPVDSSNVTSSRVLARLPDYVDTDSSDDWFTTKARLSTFGRDNVFDPYEEIE